MQKRVKTITVVAVVGVAVVGWFVWQKREPSVSAQAAGRGGPPMAVEVAPVRLATVIDRAESVGTARANESVTVTAKQTGTVAAIGFQEGEKVKANHVLIEFEGKERRADLEGVRADLDSARAARDEIRQRLERARQLRTSGNIAESQYDQLEAQNRAAESRVRSAEARIRAVDARLDDVRIYAPFEGRVGLRQVSLGALIQPGTPITTLDDISKIKVEFAVPEVHLGRLSVGQEVAARTAAFPGRTFSGRVVAVDTRVDPATRAVKVNALFDNPDEVLKPGIFLLVELVLEKRENAVMAPEDALVAEGTKQFVFVVRDNRVERREIKIGQRLPGEVEIADGLKPGDIVVARGVQKVRNGQPVTPQPLRPVS